MDPSAIDWVALLREAATSPLGVVALAVIVMLFVTLGIGTLTATQRFTVAISVVLLAALFGFLVLRGPVAPAGGSICLLRNTTLSRSAPVDLPGTGVSVELQSTQVGRDGPQPRGAAVVVTTSSQKRPRYLVEGGRDEVSIEGRTYLADVRDVMENTISLSLCRSL